MSKVSSYKKLYYVGFTFLFVILSLLVYVITIISKEYNWRPISSSKKTETVVSQPDTVYQEKIVEKLKVDTLKVYIPVKPKVEKKDTTIVPSLSTSNQSQN